MISANTVMRRCHGDWQEWFKKPEGDKNVPAIEKPISSICDAQDVQEHVFSTVVEGAFGVGIN
jgi:hypothetical protein